MNKLFRKKRNEDLKTVFDFITSYFEFLSFSEKGVPFINANWFVVEIPESQSENFKNLFIRKTEGFMKKLIEKVDLQPSFLLIAEKRPLSEKIEELLSGILLTSPKGKIFFFVTDEKLLPDYLNFNQNKKIKLGQVEIYLFEDLITTLNKPDRKKRFFEILKNINNS